MSAGLKIANASRGSRREYQADLLLDGAYVGRVERGFVQGGFRAGDYRATIGRWVIATGRTLADLRAELRDPDAIADAREAAADEAERRSA